MKKGPEQERNWGSELELPPNLEPEARELVIELYRDYAGKYDEFFDEWYDAETEARVGLDRTQAIERLRAFVEKLRATPRTESD
jgi:hypothetical protein